LSAPTQPYLQVVHALVAGESPPGEVLLGLREDAAYVHMHDGSVAIVINPSKRGAELEAAIREHLAEDRQTHLKLVIVGGGADMREVLGRVQPGLLSRRMVQAYHLGADGTVWSGRRSSLDTPVGRVLHAVADGKGAPTVAFGDLLARVPRISAEDFADARRHYDFVRRFRGRRPVLTRCLLAALLVVFGLELLWGGGDYLPTLVRMGANTDASLGPEPWRLLASVCLHGGELHFIANAVVLWILGDLLERIVGWARMSILLVVSGLAGSVASALLSDALLSVGASGAIWGVLAAVAVIAWRPRGLLPPAIVHRLRRAAGINLVINLAASFLPEVDLWAHLGGGVAGAALVWAGAVTRGITPLHEQETVPAKDPPVLRGVALACLAALLASLVTAIVVGRPWLLVRPPTMVEREFEGFAFEVPDLLGEPEPWDEDGVHGVLLGDLLQHPFVIAVDTGPRVANDLLEAKGRRIDDASVPTYEEDLDYPSGVAATIRTAFFPRARVTIEVATTPGTPEPWLTAMERTLSSVKGDR
jgi:membrane associated rhomboid family serine protease